MNKKKTKSKHATDKKEARPSTRNGKVTKREHAKEQKLKPEIKTKNYEIMTTSKSPKSKSNCEKAVLSPKGSSQNNTNDAIKTSTQNTERKKPKKLIPKGTDIVKNTFKSCSLQEPRYMVDGTPLFDPTRILAKTVSFSKAMKRSPILQTQINMPPGYYRNLANQIELAENKKERSSRYLNVAVSEMRSKKHKKCPKIL